jgi:hypothetical protein
MSANDARNSTDPVPAYGRRTASRVPRAHRAANGSGHHPVRGLNRAASRGCRRVVVVVSEAGRSVFALAWRASAFADQLRNVSADRAVTRHGCAIARPCCTPPSGCGQVPWRFDWLIWLAIGLTSVRTSSSVQVFMVSLGHGAPQRLIVFRSRRIFGALDLFHRACVFSTSRGTGVVASPTNSMWQAATTALRTLICSTAGLCQGWARINVETSITVAASRRQRQVRAPGAPSRHHRQRHPL